MKKIILLLIMSFGIAKAQQVDITNFFDYENYVCAGFDAPLFTYSATPEGGTWELRNLNWNSIEILDGLPKYLNYSYQGQYSLKYTYNNISDSVLINFVQNPMVYVSNKEICPGDSLVVKNEDYNYNFFGVFYQWSGPNVFNANNDSIKVSEIGEYYVTAFSMGCMSTYNFTVSQKTGCSTSIEEANETANNILVFPNPTSENTTVQISSTENTIATITIFDLLGQKLYSENVGLSIGQNQITLSTDQLSNGVYSLQVNSTLFKNSSSLIVQH